MKPLSPAALDLFRLHVERHRDLVVDDFNRELARAGFMQAVTTFAGGPQSAYRVTKEGFDRMIGDNYISHVWFPDDHVRTS